MPECLIALGGNLQITEKTFEDAVAMLRQQGCCDLLLSRSLTTRPVGSEAGGVFLNAAAVLRTSLRADELLQSLHDIEARFSRVRNLHWGPRTLDLDLILYGGHCINEPRLVVPHPAMWYRRFVLEPAVEVAAHMIHPILNESVAQLYTRLTGRPLRLEICSARSPSDSRVLDEIMARARQGDDLTEWCLTTLEADTSPQSFARIIVQLGAKTTTPQPFNRIGREIEVVGRSVPDIVAQIADLKLAMSG